MEQTKPEQQHAVPKNQQKIKSMQPLHHNPTPTGGAALDQPAVPQMRTQNSSPTRHQMGRGSTNQCVTRTPVTAEPTPPHNKGLRKKANVKIGTVNINGLHTAAEGNNTFEKWAKVNATMKKEKIAILAIQETHLDEQKLESINHALGKRLLVINSQLESNLKMSAGVAFVLNKDIIEAKKINSHELIKGRALAIILTWKNEEETFLINVYAPNKKSDHKDFWERVENERLNKHLCKPDFVLGDFNMTEEPIDRSPAKHDNQGSKAALREFRLSTGVVKGFTPLCLTWAIFDSSGLVVSSLRSPPEVWANEVRG